MQKELNTHDETSNYIYQSVDSDESLTILATAEDELEINSELKSPDLENYILDEVDHSSDLISGEISAHAINLVVRCEIGMVNVSLEKLTQLKIGDVLELTRWPNTVKLTANGAYFAEGILVEVEGMLGVKLTRKLSK